MYIYLRKYRDEISVSLIFIEFVIDRSQDARICTTRLSRENDLRYIACCLRKKNSLCNDPLVQAREVDPIKFLSLSLSLSFTLSLSLSFSLSLSHSFLHPPSRFVNVESKKHFDSNSIVTRCESGELLKMRRDVA